MWSLELKVFLRAKEKSMTHAILVRHITHLTDARYFAAMGVDWISMRLDADPKSFMRWHSIRDWVEGLKLLAEPASGDEELLARVIIDAKPDGILLPGGVDFRVPDGVVLFKEGIPQSESEFGIVRYDGGDPLSTNPASTNPVSTNPLPPEEGEMIFMSTTDPASTDPVSTNPLPPKEGEMVFMSTTDPLSPEEGEKIFLEAEWTLDLIKQVQTAGYKGGFCFYGGAEEAIGVRDYEGMDEIIEWVKG